MSLSHPLLARLAETLGRTVLSAEELDAFLAEPGDAVLFCGGDPRQYPECLDVAVVLPELLATHPGRLRAAMAAPELGPELQARYGFTRWPSLVFLRDGGYLGVISGMQDWPDYIARMAALLAAGVSRPPTVGVAVAVATPACH